MFKMTIALAALAAATTANAAPVPLNFNTLTGTLGTTQTYTSGSLSVTATGYSSNGHTTALFGKNDAGDEKGLGLAGYTDNEINYPGSDFIQLDVHNLFGLVTGASFFMGSSTDGETWKVFGTNTAGQLGTFLIASGSNESLNALTSWGTYKYYDFVATADPSNPWPHDGNVLLGGLSVTAAVPEPATWAMMLIGFGGIGFASRRRKSSTLKLA